MGAVGGFCKSTPPPQAAAFAPDLFMEDSLFLSACSWCFRYNPGFCTVVRLRAFTVGVHCLQGNCGEEGKELA